MYVGEGLDLYTPCEFDIRGSPKIGVHQNGWFI